MPGDQQQYEFYWKITLGYSDFFGDNFRRCLGIIVAFIDEQKGTPFSQEKYESLQDRISRVTNINPASIRKIINQYIKLGFVRPELVSYHPATKTFLAETNLGKKKSLFSKIIYSDSSFDSSVTKQSNNKEINFLIKTLQEVGILTRDDVLALMTVDVGSTPKDYLDRATLEERRRFIDANNFEERKYNQRNYLWNILEKLDGLVVRNDAISLQTDTTVVEGVEEGIAPRKRDPYLHQIYKNQLKEESSSQFGKVACMTEKLAYPSLVASHIKPFSLSSEIEAYDANNGLLLSRNMDLLFDQGYISFSSDGSILISERLSEDVRTYLRPFTLDTTFLADARLAYLEYHREHVFS